MQLCKFVPDWMPKPSEDVWQCVGRSKTVLQSLQQIGRCRSINAQSQTINFSIHVCWDHSREIPSNSCRRSHDATDWESAPTATFEKRWSTDKLAQEFLKHVQKPDELIDVYVVDLCKFWKSANKRWPMTPTAEYKLVCDTHVRWQLLASINADAQVLLCKNETDELAQCIIIAKCTEKPSFSEAGSDNNQLSSSRRDNKPKKEK